MDLEYTHSQANNHLATFEYVIRQIKRIDCLKGHDNLQTPLVDALGSHSKGFGRGHAFY